LPDRHTEPHFVSAALITIDVQRDFLDDGPFPIAGTNAALAAITSLLDAFRKAHRPIVHVIRLYDSGGEDADRCRRGLLERGAALALPGSPGSQLAPSLLPSADLSLDHRLLKAGGIQQLADRETVVYKPRWGAFYNTRLEAHLREQNVSTLVFCGCNFPNCPRTSIYEASERDFRVVLATDAVSGLYARGEQELRAIGVALTSAEQAARSVSEATARAAA
jgi:nicotinamidase-related amidase